MLALNRLGGLFRLWALESALQSKRLGPLKVGNGLRKGVWIPFPYAGA